MTSNWFPVLYEDFCSMIGVSVDYLDESVKEELESKNLRLRQILGDERSNLICDIISLIERDSQIVGSRARRSTWETGWAEHMAEIGLCSREMGVSAYEALKASLTPKFTRPGMPIRWNGRYHATSPEAFELSFQHLIRFSPFPRYLAGIKYLYEFGAGTGINLLHASELLPQLELVGMDFTQSSCELIEGYASSFDLPLRACNFDMTTLKPQINLEPHVGVLTWGALEQIGSLGAKSFLTWLASQKPSLVLHIEPCAIFFDRPTVEDVLGRWFFQKRGYTRDIYTSLRELQENRSIELLVAKRIGFGSTLMEINMFVWTTDSQRDRASVGLV